MSSYPLASLYSLWFVHLFSYFWHFGRQSHLSLDFLLRTHLLWEICVSLFTALLTIIFIDSVRYEVHSFGTVFVFSFYSHLTLCEPFHSWFVIAMHLYVSVSHRLRELKIVFRFSPLLSTLFTAQTLNSRHSTDIVVLQLFRVENNS